MEVGSIKLGVITHYLSMIGKTPIILAMFFFAIWITLDVAGNLWLSKWSGNADARELEIENRRIEDPLNFNQTQEMAVYLQDTFGYIKVYVLIGVGVIIFTYARTLSVFYLTLGRLQKCHRETRRP